MRLFSIIQWHHFAYMMISVALLGYGAAGTFVASGAAAAARALRTVFVGAAAALRRERGRGLRARAAGGVQPARNAVGSAAAAAAPRRLRAAVRAVLLRGDRAVPHVHAVRETRRTASTASTSSAPAPAVSRSSPRCSLLRPRMRCRFTGALGLAAAAVAALHAAAEPARDRAAPLLGAAARAAVRRCRRTGRASPRPNTRT